MTCCQPSLPKFQTRPARLDQSEIKVNHVVIGPNKTISVFRLTGLKILGRVGTHIF